MKTKDITMLIIDPNSEEQCPIYYKPKPYIFTVDSHFNVFYKEL